MVTMQVAVCRRALARLSLFLLFNSKTNGLKKIYIYKLHQLKIGNAKQGWGSRMFQGLWSFITWYSELVGLFMTYHVIGYSLFLWL